MITILAVLEKGYESSFEHLAFRQIKGAFDCKLVCVPHDFDTLQEALDNTTGKKVFMIPPGRVVRSQEFSKVQVPEDVVFVLGSPQENLVSYINSDTVAHITTTKNTDLMSVTVAGIILYVHG